MSKCALEPPHAFQILAPRRLEYGLLWGRTQTKPTRNKTLHLGLIACAQILAPRCLEYGFVWDGVTSKYARVHKGIKVELLWQFAYAGGGYDYFW